MTITFENDSNSIVYALEKVISYSRDRQYIFLAQSIWWIASSIGLQQELITSIDKLKTQANIGISVSPSTPERFQDKPINSTSGDKASTSSVHPDRTTRISVIRGVSATPRKLTEDRRQHQILERAEQFIEESESARNSWQHSRGNPVPQTKSQLKKARKVKRLQEAKKSAAAL